MENPVPHEEKQKQQSTAYQLAKKDTIVSSQKEDSAKEVKKNLFAFSISLQRPGLGLLGLVLLLIVGCRQNDKGGSEGSAPGSTTDSTFIAPEMVLISAGTFDMGSDIGGDDQKPIHKIRLDSFYLSKYEVSVEEFKKFIEDTGHETDADKDGGSSCWTGKDFERKSGVNWQYDAEGQPVANFKHPVIHVSWNDATAYAKWLSKKAGLTYRLPTEAEWEYAAGNGRKHTKYSWGNVLPEGKQGGNVADESAATAFDWKKSADNIFLGYDDAYVFTAPVGSFAPNKLGLYDMSGNVYEWCQDWYGSDY